MMLSERRQSQRFYFVHAVFVTFGKYCDGQQARPSLLGDKGVGEYDYKEQHDGAFLRR